MKYDLILPFIKSVELKQPDFEQSLQQPAFYRLLINYSGKTQTNVTYCGAAYSERKMLRLYK